MKLLQSWWYHRIYSLYLSLILNLAGHIWGFSGLHVEMIMNETRWQFNLVVIVVVEIKWSYCSMCVFVLIRPVEGPKSYKRGLKVSRVLSQMLFTGLQHIEVSCVWMIITSRMLCRRCFDPLMKKSSEIYEDHWTSWSNKHNSQHNSDGHYFNIPVILLYALNDCFYHLQ